MNDDDQRERTPTAAPRQRRSLPHGYRQGVITAITVLLGFSLTFLRFWSFEAEGKWAWHSLLSTGLVGVAIVLQLVALFRSLQPEDDDEDVYRVTVRWFIVAIALLMAGLLFAALEISLA